MPAPNIETDLLGSIVEWKESSYDTAVTRGRVRAVALVDGDFILLVEQSNGKLTREEVRYCRIVKEPW